MNLLDMVLDSRNSGSLQQLADRFGLDQQQVAAAVAEMVPALSSGLKQNLADPARADGLVAALQRGGHQRVIERPEQLAQSSAVDDGNALLGQLFGSKEVSRAVAGRATEKTGLDSGLLQQMLPLVASIAMGSMSQKAGAEGLLGARSEGGQEGAGLVGMLTNMIDADNDGSVLDDLVGLAGKFLR